MKIRRVLYFILGIFLIAINLLLDITNSDKHHIQTEDAAYNIGAFIGGHIFIVAGFFLVRAGYKLNKKIRAIDNEITEKDIDSIGQ